MKCKWIVIMLFTATAVIAQQKKTVAQCQDSFKVFEAKTLEGNYPEAATLYGQLQKECPKTDAHLYELGEKIFLYNIEVSPKGEKQRAEIDKLVTLYAQYAKNFPASAIKADISRAMLQKKYKLAADDDVFKTLDAAFIKNSASFTNHEALEAYFLLYLKRFEENKGVTQDQLIAKYAEVAAQAAAVKADMAEKQRLLLNKEQSAPLTSAEKLMVAEYAEKMESFTAVEENADILARKHFNCDKLEAYYTSAFEANKASAQWLRSTSLTLYKAKCSSSKTLQKSIEAWYSAAPDAQSAMYMGLMAQRKNNIADAVKYFDEAARLEPTAEKKAEMYYNTASLIRLSDKKLAKDYVLKAAQLNTKSGRPHVFLAELYMSAGKECDLTEFDRKALVWLAAESLKKAEQAEARYKATAEAMMVKYSKKAPVKADLKAAGKKAGQKITFGCWINETITIPNL